MEVLLFLIHRIPLTNFAERGAGYEYISSKVINTADKDPSTLHIIMWPSADRFDLWVNGATPHLQNDIDGASWLDGNRPKFVDEFGEYNDTRGWYISGAIPRGLKHIYYKYFYSQEYHINHAWKTILFIQKYLDSMQLNYVMASTYPLNNLIQYHNDSEINVDKRIFEQINLNKFVDKAIVQGFIQFSINNNEVFFNPHYPNSAAHEHYVDSYLIPKINELLHTSIY